MELKNLIKESLGKKFKLVPTGVDPETGSSSSEVKYFPDFISLLELLDNLVETFKGISSFEELKGDSKLADLKRNSELLRNAVRLHLRKNYASDYQQYKQKLPEISTTGTGATFTPGKGEQYASPKAFQKKGNKPVIYYYKLGFKPVNKTKLRKASKGIEVIDIYK